MKLNPRLQELLNKEYNTEEEVNEMKNHEQILDIQNVGFINKDNPKYEQLNIIVGNDFNNLDNDIYYNFLIRG